jgi:hypothetical protein
MKRKKFEELQQRMTRHAVVNDTAVVVLTAKELYDLLELARPHIEEEERKP